MQKRFYIFDIVDVIVSRQFHQVSLIEKMAPPKKIKKSKNQKGVKREASYYDRTSKLKV